MDLYEHPNSRTREQMAAARERAAKAVKEHLIAWNPEKGLSGGFTYADGRRIETTTVHLLVALCELREAGLIGVSPSTGLVWWVTR